MEFPDFCHFLYLFDMIWLLWLRKRDYRLKTRAVILTRRDGSIRIIRNPQISHIFNYQAVAFSIQAARRMAQGRPWTSWGHFSKCTGYFWKDLPTKKWALVSTRRHFGFIELFWRNPEINSWFSSRVSPTQEAYFWHLGANMLAGR